MFLTNVTGLTHGSDKIVKVKCQFNISDTCKKIVEAAYKSIYKTISNNDGKYICFNCSNAKKGAARKSESDNRDKTDLTGLSHGSDKIVQVNCEFNISKKCKKTVETFYRSVYKTMSNNDGKYICFACNKARDNKTNNRKNVKYDIDENFFKNIDTENKAYLLGWIASDGHIADGSWYINIHKKDIKTLEKLRNLVCNTLPIKNYNDDDMVKFTVHAKKMCQDLCKWLKLDFKEDGPHKKSFIVQFPDLETDELKWHFLRGYLEGDGCISIKKGKNARIPHCCIASHSPKMLESIRDFCNIKCCITNHQIIWIGSFALQFLNNIYKKCELYLDRKYKIYQSFKDWFPHNFKILETFKYTRTIPEAIAPRITDRKDKSYNVYLIKEIKRKDDIIYFDTCLKLEPHNGYVLEISYLNALKVLGYELLNDNQIIDHNYTGTLIVKLKKLTENSVELNLPIKLIKIIPKKIENK